MDILISNSSGKPIYEQITNQLKTLISSGALAQGEALPSMRLLARELRISVITTKRAYEELERDGFIETVAGKGSFVAGKNLELLREYQLQQVEAALQKAVELAQSSAIGCEELIEMMTLLYKEEA
ncbi:MAG: GntR family transcriptional regulator [Oscillospiraceae bacterium]